MNQSVDLIFKTKKPNWSLYPIFYTLRARLIFSVALVHVVLMSFFTWEAVESQSQQLRQELITQGRSLASLMVVASTNAILAEDLASLAEVTRRVGEQSDVAYGEVVDVRGYVMASTKEGRVGHKVGPVNIENEQFPLVDDDQVFDLREDVRIGNSQVGFVTRLACVGEMAASIAHEIRNPLAALINSVQLLGREDLAENDHEQVVDIVNKESQRLQRILSEFLSFARLPNSVIEAHDINVLIEETTELISRDPVCGEGITIERHYDNDGFCKFDWDQLRQVMLVQSAHYGCVK